MHCEQVTATRWGKALGRDAQNGRLSIISQDWCEGEQLLMEKKRGEGLTRTVTSSRRIQGGRIRGDAKESVDKGSYDSNTTILFDAEGKKKAKIR